MTRSGSYEDKTDGTRSVEKMMRPIKRSISDRSATTQSGYMTHVATNPAFCSNEQGRSDTTNLCQHNCLRPGPSHAQARGKSSRSRIEIRLHYRDPTVSSATLLPELMAQTKQAGSPVRRLRQVQVADTAVDQYNVMATHNLNPNIQWFACAHSISHPDLRMTSAQQNKHNLVAPLKTCLRNKAKGTATTPTENAVAMTEDDPEIRTLRRMKTVDFEDAGNLLLASPTRTKPRKTRYTVDVRANEVPAQCNMPKNSTRSTPSYPNMLSTAKSALADPTTTHTDVHVLAIAPFRDTDETTQHVHHNNHADPATPTMQIVESNSDYHEIVRDDVPTQHKIRTSRRRSSANHSLKAVSSLAMRGLQSVNTKLPDWSGSWNATSSMFKPTIAVFPDNDGKSHQIEYAADDDEELIAPVPPNSQRANVAPSRLPSRLASAPLTRAASQEKLSLEDAFQEGIRAVPQDWVAPLEDTLLAPNLGIQCTRPHNANRRLRQMPVISKLSNGDGDGDDLRFRGHRDSVTLAHSRLMHTGGISPELFARKDSVSMARKRMHARDP
jgi:hypothetical protein